MPEIDETTLRAVDANLVERYSSRLSEFGDDPRTLGWDRRENQLARFRTATECCDFAGRTVLDVGCGLADFREFLGRREGSPSFYAGVDINPDLLVRCRERFPECSFHRGNLLLDEVPGTPFDVVVLFGILNFRFKELPNLDFAQNMIRHAFDCCREAVVVDMLTTLRDKAYPEEDFVHYYDPMEMLDFALGLTPHVSLRHDYRSIPQREMMLVLRHQPARSDD